MKARGGYDVIIKENILNYEGPKIEEETRQATTMYKQTKNKKDNVTAVCCPLK